MCLVFGGQFFVVLTKYAISPIIQVAFVKPVTKLYFKVDQSEYGISLDDVRRQPDIWHYNKILRIRGYSVSTELAYQTIQLNYVCG